MGAKKKPTPPSPSNSIFVRTIEICVKNQAPEIPTTAFDRIFPALFISSISKLKGLDLATTMAPPKPPRFPGFCSKSVLLLLLLAPLLL
jgi:hypothetical protein